jgi:hypothetical protein
MGMISPIALPLSSNVEMVHELCVAAPVAKAKEKL